jgi:hypothetical protein
MGRKAFTPEVIINRLRESDILLSQEDRVGETRIKIGVT